ncbi:anhydro-N-acetylmuramic acid kinase [Pasteurella bettyae]|uniref:Anhydro-N-acetylmuramic acid kinase n=1 Tax=Pasteurella bettyae CCUG 2042 TaxID=1095749 RepID=I3D8X2_9PAST|nr:anhydro-N-acetylmuramic acid kinase [Pasteurella bettyae]EIJ68165.1 anhydro-N-acetylmuramic acid kinase [Pasteurella bettyae CCUG 2042]SUB22493.1 anhydro-N-acetylmuramic acid kinase [Pasteurella bettyae]
MSQYYIGVMSGTSLDGVDLALMDFAQNPAKLIASDFTPMPEEIRQNLTALLHSSETSLQKLGELDHQLGKLYAQSINQFLQKVRLDSEKIVAIGCHGQTIWHSPNSVYPFTMQIGDMNIVAEQTGITTIADFRRRDIAVGGQGAPLVPAFHQDMFSANDRLTLVLNIGGISNISVLDPNQPTIGYDVSVGNALLDSWIEFHQGKRYDKNAEWAKSGVLNESLLTELLDEPYFQQPPPKSTGRELFNLAWLNKKLAKFTALLAAEDVQRTLVEFTAVSIANELKNLQKTDRTNLLLVCGGGARNPLIMQRLIELLPTWQVSTTTEFGLDIDYVEAAAFAWLAYRRMHNLASNLPSVTGASKLVSLGVIYPK